jgi:hypothetical protein
LPIRQVILVKILGHTKNDFTYTHGLTSFLRAAELDHDLVVMFVGSVTAWRAEETDVTEAASSTPAASNTEVVTVFGYWFRLSSKRMVNP